MKSNDFVKYLTVSLMQRVNNPKEETNVVITKKKDPISNRWFGLIPLSLKMLARRNQKNI